MFLVTQLMQGKKHITNKLTEERIQALDKLGFVWFSTGEHNKLAFAVRLLQLEAYKVEHGNCKVERKLDESLYHWSWKVNVSCNAIDAGEETHYKKLTEERIQALDK